MVLNTSAKKWFTWRN